MPTGTQIKEARRWLELAIFFKLSLWDALREAEGALGTDIRENVLDHWAVECGEPANAIGLLTDKDIQEIADC